MILRSGHVADANTHQREELHACLERTGYPDMFRWDAFDHMITVRDLISDALVGALTYRLVDSGRVMRLGKFVSVDTHDLIELDGYRMSPICGGGDAGDSGGGDGPDANPDPSPEPGDVLFLGSANQQLHGRATRTRA
jgi:hypothetical protein